MAITTYENRIPPSLEHLIWGGGYDGTLDLRLNYRCYAGDNCVSGYELSTYSISIYCFELDDYIYVGSSTNYLRKYNRIYKVGASDYNINIALSDSNIDISPESTEIYFDLIPESWVSYLQNVANVNYIYKLPIR